MRMRWKLLVGLGVLLAGSAVLLGMAGSSADTEQDLREVRSTLDRVKADLPDMACCTEPQCNFCPLAAGKCPCGSNIKTDVGVCGECYDGWRAGEGRVPGVQPDDVPHLADEAVQMMYDARAQHFEN